MRTRRLGLGLVLTTTMAGATFGPVIFSVLATPLREEFAAARWQVGGLVAANFAAGALLSAWLGSWTDSITPRRATAYTMLIAAVGFLLMAVAPSYWLFAAAGAITGIAQGACNPATNRLIMTQAETGSRGLLTGIKQAGVQAGNVLGGILLPIGAASALGWRGSVAAACVIPAVGLVVLSLLTRGRAPAETARGPEVEAVISDVMRRLAVFATCMGVVTGSLFTYLSLFAQETFAWSTEQGGALVAAFGAVGLVARLTGGQISERYLGHHRSLALMAAMAGAAAVVLALSPSAGWLWVAAVLIGLGAMAWNVVANIVVMESSPLAGAGRSSGVMNGGFLAGMAAGPPLFGWAVDLTSTYRPGWWTIALVAAVSVWIALGIRP